MIQTDRALRQAREAAEHGEAPPAETAISRRVQDTDLFAMMGIATGQA